MKKIFLSLFAIASLAFLLVSCTRGNEDTLVNPNPEVIDPRVLVTSADSTRRIIKSSGINS